MIKTGIVGGGSIVANEIMKIISIHPEAELIYVTSETSIGKPVSTVHNNLQGIYDDLLFSKYSADEISGTCDIVFICKSHGESSSYVKDLFDSDCKIIDMGGDFRLKDVSIFNFWYHGAKHACPEILNKAVYGLPELYKEKIKKTNLLANPGCYATSIILALAPLLKDNLINPNEIIICSSSGISGAGREPKPGFNMFMDVYRNVKPYKLGVHPHIGEIEQELKNFSVIVSVSTQISEEVILKCYENFYSECGFIQILKDRIPDVKDILGTNMCSINAKIDKHSSKLIIFSAIDNLIKGAAGQGVQNMNLMFGLPDTAGLEYLKK
ncbi:N-acetyl-gamma-glutamyl-phosphate reductase [Candidatus Desantisbacteria bacterium]|nr:N-acetyl-gamma-glutamyl-phosphate reductase [Candidatus Desantisbacteria bacterium]